MDHRHCQPKPRHRRGVTLLEVAVATGVIGLLLAIVVPAIQSAREASRLTTCRSHLKQIGLATQQYDATHGILPPGSCQFFSVHVSLLPYLDQKPLFDLVQFTPFDAAGAGNKPVIQQRPPHLICPSDGAAAAALGKNWYPTSYPGNYGVDYQRRGFDGFFQPLETFSDAEAESDKTLGGPLRVAQIRDGLSQTAAFSEALSGDPRFADSPGSGDPRRGVFHTPYAVFQVDELPDFCRSVAAHHLATRPRTIAFSLRGNPWTEGVPSEALYNHVSTPNQPACINDSQMNEGTYPASSAHSGTVNVCFGDGHVDSVSANIDAGVWQALGTRAEREVLGSMF